LLVVTAIIAILASLLLPALSRSRSMARQAACMNNIKNVTGVIQLYADDNDDWLPASYKGGWLWFNTFIKDYVGDQREKGIVRCPDYRPMKHGGNYGLSENWFAYPGWGKPNHRVNEISNASNAAWLLDVYYEGSNANSASQFYTGRNWSNWHYRHLGKVDLGFADGHVANENRVLSGIDTLWTGN